MGIWDRLGNVVKSYLNDEDTRIFKRNPARGRLDSDLNAAWEELDDFLDGKATGWEDVEKAGEKKRAERRRKISVRISRNSA